MIPKPDGSQRELGIPTLLDRLIQQAWWTVDLAKFFDRVNHDILIDRLCKRIDDAGVVWLVTSRCRTSRFASGNSRAAQAGAAATACARPC